MSDVAIKVDNVSKVFRIYDRPGDRLREAFSFGRRKLHTDFRALRDITFEVRKGEFLGVVGKNGAGKTTILRILSGELTPTAGSVSIDGKVSLLQLGMGFDPELTGIENARFASKLLGYSDDEIERMTRHIIEFADIGEFIGHPVKTYSSGMYSRLSFAVGINVDPDILIADEVLSVGDTRFAQKCLRKMREFKERGKTAIFVSHDIQSVNAFCDTAMWVKDGAIYLHGECKHVTKDFLNYMLYDKLPHEYHAVAASGSPRAPAADTATDASAPLKLPGSSEWTELSGVACVGDGRAQITRMAFVFPDDLKTARNVQGNEDVMLLLDIRANGRIDCPQVGFVLYNRQGLPALHTNNEVCGTPIPVMVPGQRFIAIFRFRLPSLGNGSYVLSVGVQAGPDMPHKIDDAYEIYVARSDVNGQQCGYVIVEEGSFSLLDGNP